MKASDYEAVIQNHPELRVEGIRVYHNVSDLAVDYQRSPNSWPFREIPPASRALLVDYKLPEPVRAVIRDFGHSDQEIDDYERSKNSERLRKRTKSEFLENFIKVARGVWYDYLRRPPHLAELREYLDNCGIEYTWNPD